MQPSGYRDSFARDRLPPPDQWPVFLRDRPEHRTPDRLNCVTWLLDRWLAGDHAARPAILAPGTSWTYRDLAARVNRIAHVLTGKLGMESGNRVLLRAPNTPMLAAAYLAVMKAGGIAVATPPLLRARELAAVIDKARPALALCDTRLPAALEPTDTLARIVGFAELETLMRDAPDSFAACDSAADDVCLLGFTSGTTGTPKATMHFHRDLPAIAESYGRHVLRATAEDRFIGSPPLAFTFGLGGLLVFPLAVGAASVLLEQASPDHLRAAIKQFAATVLFTAPTAYRALLGGGGAPADPASSDPASSDLANFDPASLRICVSAGEALSRATFDAWWAATGIAIQDGIGSTELLHIFIGSPADAIRPGATGRPVPGYVARVIGEDGRAAPPGTPGLLAVQGPTGCRYLDDKRQTAYVRDGWNLTGDVYVEDDDGYFWYQARADDMIVSAGYNIAGPEVEAALLTHPAVAECAVVGAPDAERGMVVCAYVVVRDGIAPDNGLARALQDHVKAAIAPYKYPRRVVFRAALPKTSTGKLQRAALRAEASKAPRHSEAGRPPVRVGSSAINKEALP